MACTKILQASGIITQPQEEQKERDTGIPPFLTDAYGFAEVLQISKHFYLLLVKYFIKTVKQKPKTSPTLTVLLNDTNLRQDFNLFCV